MPEITIDHNQTALLIQDMQNELIKGGAMPVQPYSGEEIIANSVRLLEKARAVGMPVIYVVVNRRPDRRDAPPPTLRSAGQRSGRRATPHRRDS